MDTAGNLTGNGQGAGNTAANAMANADTAGNFTGNGTGSNQNNGNLDVNGSNGFAPTAYNGSAVAPAQDYVQLKAMWEAQAKQAAEMLKRIEAAQKTAAPQS